MPRPSTGEYPPNWNEIATAVKVEADWACIRCSHKHEPKTGYTLTVHHLDLNKANCKWWNLAALCQRCHLRIQGKVVMEQFYMLEISGWLKPFAAGYYASLFGIPDDKIYVLQHMDGIFTRVDFINEI